jgi:hypothetical protein
MILSQIEGLFAVAFFVIAFVGWIINLINQVQGGKKPGTPAAPRPRRQQVQQEIDQFLKQTRRPPGGETPANPAGQPVDAARQRRPPPPAQRRRSRKDVWQEQVGRPAADRLSSRSPAPDRPQRPAGSQPANRPAPVGSSLSEHHLQASVSSAEVRRDLGKMPGNQLSATIARDLPSHLSDQVVKDLGRFQASAPTSSGEQAIADTLGHRATPAESLMRLLRSRRGVRDAILVNEILSKPLGLRNRS